MPSKSISSTIIPIGTRKEVSIPKLNLNAVKFPYVLHD